MRRYFDRYLAMVRWNDSSSSTTSTVARFASRGSGLAGALTLGGSQTDAQSSSSRYVLEEILGYRSPTPSVPLQAACNQRARWMSSSPLSYSRRGTSKLNVVPA